MGFENPVDVMLKLSSEVTQINVLVHILKNAFCPQIKRIRSFLFHFHSENLSKNLLKNV